MLLKPNNQNPSVLNQFLGILGGLLDKKIKTRHAEAEALDGLDMNSTLERINRVAGEMELVRLRAELHKACEDCGIDILGITLELGEK